MELVNHKQPAREKLVLRLCKGLFCLSAVMTVFILCYLVNSPSRYSEKTSSFELPCVDKSMLGSGPLSLISSQLPSSMQSILHDLILVGANTRPDQDHDRELTLALRSTGEHKKVSIGETVYLESNDQEWRFSSQPTETALTPYSLENLRVVCEIKNASLKTQSVLTTSPIFSKSLQSEDYISLLKKGESWGPDVFLTGWGGEEYRDLTKKAKISIGPDVFFLKPGDCIWWNGVRWTQEIHTDDIGPVAQLIKTSPSQEGAHFQVWDETGFSSETVQLLPRAVSPSHFKIAELMTAIKPRSSSEITCQLEKRRVIVKAGDWWVRADNRWRQLRTAADLDAFLYHQLPGELFIFEKVETSKGKVMVQGRAFDKMRTSSEPISLVVQTEKKHPAPTNKSGRYVPSLMAKNRSTHSMTSNSGKEREEL